MEQGRIGIVTRSSSLAGEVGRQLSVFGLGPSRVECVPAPRTQGSHLALLKMFEAHWGTDAVVLLGPIDPDEEAACTDWMVQHMSKPVIGFIDPADPAHAQRERLAACGVHISRDAARIGELTASLVESPWLPFD
jgi:succinyl-CoA synthetase alpha subunit